MRREDDGIVVGKELLSPYTVSVRHMIPCAFSARRLIQMIIMMRYV